MKIMLHPRLRPITAIIFLLLGTAACGSDEPSFAGPTYHGEVAPLLARHCLACHTKDNIAPIALDGYDEARSVAPLIADATAKGRMPPWHVTNDGSCGTFVDAPTINAEEIALLGAWAEAGAPEGASAPTPEPPARDDLHNPTVTLDPGEGYLPRSDRDDDYRCFIVDPQTTSDRFLVAYQVRPDVVAQVHHVVLYSLDSDAEEAAAQALDEGEPGLGYTCFGGPGTGGGRSLAVWAPGTHATRYPAGTGLRILGGRPLVMQLHYNRGELPDRTTIDLELVEAVAHEAFITGVFDASLVLPPGVASVEQSAALPVPPLAAPLTLHGIYPHMHRYGRSLRVDLDRGGDSTCLVDAPQYDYNWQRFYFYEEPVVILPPGGGYLRINCAYDTRAATSTTYWGEGTDDEMCIAGIYASF